MRHNRRTKRLGRNHSERRALLENLVTSLLKHQQIRTTLTKAKEAQRLAEHVITLGKSGSVAARRQVFSYLQDRDLTSKLFKEVAPRFQTRKGGYTRILRIQRRKGDGAEIALLELVEKEIKVKEAPKKGKKAKEEKQEPRHEKAHEAPRMEQPKPEAKPQKPKGGFFKNLGRFFRNKGGG